MCLVAGFPALNAQTPFSGSSTVCTTPAATGKTVTSPPAAVPASTGGTASCIGTWYCLICSGSSQEMQLFATRVALASIGRKPQLPDAAELHRRLEDALDGATARLAAVR